MKPPADATPPAISPSGGGVVRRWVSGIWQQQKQMAYGPRHKQLLGETKAALTRVRDLKVAPKRVETFEEAVARQRLKPDVLAQQLRRFKAAHLGLYFVAGVLAVYSAHLALNVGVMYGLGSFIAALGAAVNGYLHGYRAWQIEHRNLIRLQDAVRMPETYLVL